MEQILPCPFHVLQRTRAKLQISPPFNVCSHAFNFGAALLCVGDFSQKIV